MRANERRASVNWVAMSLAVFLLTKCRHARDKAFSVGTTFSVPSLAVALVVAIAL